MHAIRKTWKECGMATFCPKTGTGYTLRYVARTRRQTTPRRTVALGHGLADAALRDLFGGWSEPVVRLFRRMQDKVRNKLTKRQYENEVSWSTSTWLALQSQRLSVAVHIAAAWEIATEMQLAGGGAEAPSSDEEGGATA